MARDKTELFLKERGELPRYDAPKTKKEQEDQHLLHVELFLLRSEDVGRYTEEIEKLSYRWSELEGTAILYPNDEMVRQEMGQIGVNVKRLCVICSRDIKVLMSLCESFKKSKKKYVASLRIQETQMRCIQASLKNVVDTFRVKNIEYEEACRVRLTRQYKIVYGEEPTPLELDHLMLNPGQIFQDHATILGNLDVTLDDVNERHREMQQLSQNIEEMYDIIKDITDVIADSGETLDNIQHDVACAESYVSKGAQRAQATYEEKKICFKGRFWCYIIGAVATVMLVAGIVVGVFFLTKGV